MKILHVLASSVGGGASHVYDHMVHAPPAIKQKLVISDDGGTVQERLRTGGYDVEEIDMTQGWKWSSFLRLIQIIRIYRPSIVHCHGLRAALYGRLAAKFVSFKIKTVVTIHGFHCFYYPFWKKNLILFLEHLLKPLTNYVIAVSNTDWKHLFECNLISKENSSIVLNGIPLSVSTNPPSLQRTDRPIIGTVSRLHYQKGVLYFLQAVPHILQAIPNAHFLIIGDGPERESLLQLAKDFPQVSFLGNRDDVNDLLPQFDVFVLASLWEGLPISLLEAIRAEVPIVATDVDGNRDVMENEVTGLLVAPKDSKALADAIIRIAQTPSLREKFIPAAKKRLETDFSISAMLQKTHQIYSEL